MNEKLKALQGKISQWATKGSVGWRGGSDALVIVSISSSEKEKKDHIRISFHRRIMALTGWVAGDKLDMEITGENAIIFRSPEKGRKLGKYNKNGTTRPPVRFSVPYKSAEGIPSGEGTHVEASAGVVAFVWPK